LYPYTRLFSRIPKNDYGRGGAWDFYWGALYPRGLKRTTSAQLFVAIHAEYFDFGFFVGQYGTDVLEQFLTTVTSHRAFVMKELEPFLNDPELTFGERPALMLDDHDKIQLAKTLTWDDWVADPATHGVRVGILRATKDAVNTPPEQLADEIATWFERLFPLVLLAISSDPITEISAFLEPDDDEVDEPHPEYTLEEFSDETSIDPLTLERWVRALKRKQQVIFYGPPGTGKTYVAERLAKHVVGGGTGFTELVQFHPAYAYEDFIQGIRPSTDREKGLRYDVEPGVFLRFCSRARGTKDPCVFVIDEINRANLSRVFGELMYLLEYRDREIPLAGSRTFRIPENVYIIGTMNTADRSIALVDHALRRRFSFLNLRPDYEILRDYHARNETGFSVDGLIHALEAVNRDIADPHYEVGISFFLRDDLDTEIEDIWRLEIEPYLEEFFFGQSDRWARHRWEKVQEMVLSA
jgi:5-methylcytosine-specific restriction protein B